MHRMTLYRKVMMGGLALIALFGVFAMGYVMGTRAPNRLARAQGEQPANTEDLFVPFWEAWNLLHENYVDPLDDDLLMQGAITGMMESIGDPHTDYMDPETFALINEVVSGEYEGIGAAVQQNKTTGGLELLSIFEGSPAAKAGLLPGDQIIEVEGKNITKLNQDEIIAQVRGPAGTTVRLGILRPGEPDLFQVDVAREKITIPAVSYQVLDGNIGYLRLSQFESSASDQMRMALIDMDANHLNGLILDLRGNPGGYLTTAIEVASAYIPEGPIVIERGPKGEYTYDALGNAIAPDVPMVVLVDEGSASASELIAGALQDRGRAVIIGTITFGKGSVQTWRQLSNGGGVRITISRWYTPDGHSVSDVGINPDINIAYHPDQADPDHDNQLEMAIHVLQHPDLVPAHLKAKQEAAGKLVPVR